MRIPRAELADLLIYQIGALRGFLEAEGMALNHIKPHGVLYGMAARQEEVAHAVCDAAEVFGVPLFGMAGTLHEKVYRELCLRVRVLRRPRLRREGRPDHHPRASRGRSAAGGGALLARGRGGQGQEHRRQRHTGARDSVCVHSDTPNAVDIAKAVKQALAPSWGAPPDMNGC